MQNGIHSWISFMTNKVGYVWIVSWGKYYMGNLIYVPQSILRSLNVI
jgi:hypothetical protein